MTTATWSSGRRELQMATNKVVIAGSSVSASQLKEFFGQINGGIITGHIMQAIIQHEWARPREITVRSDGRAKATLVSELCRAGHGLGTDALTLLAGDVVITDGKTYRLGIMYGSELGKKCSIQDVWAAADEFGWLKSSLEQGCLVRESLSNGEVEKWLKVRAVLIMHEPVNGRVLGLCTACEGHDFDTYGVGADCIYGSEYAFLFLIPETII
jgi:hypothetical protein